MSLPENYQVGSVLQPTGEVVGFDSVTAVGVTSGSTSQLLGGKFILTNSVWCFFEPQSFYKVQTIATTATAGVSYTLTVDTVVLTSGVLGASTLSALIIALQADVDYAAAPFTIAANATGVTVTWKVLGTTATNAVMTDDVATVYTTLTSNAGLAATTSSMLLAPGERAYIFPDNWQPSAIKVTGQSDGIVRITRCE
jgi:hypothetical protein